MSKYQNNNTASGGLGFSSVLTIIFIVLKLCGVIDWSWLWVLSPMWISFAISLVIILVVVIYCKLDERKWKGNGKNGKM